MTKQSRAFLTGIVSLIVAFSSLAACSNKEEPLSTSTSTSTSTASLKTPSSSKPALSHTPSSTPGAQRIVTSDELIIRTGEFENTRDEKPRTWTSGARTVLLDASRGDNIYLKIYGDTGQSGFIKSIPTDSRKFITSAFSPQYDASEPAGAAVATLEKLPADGLKAGAVELVIRTYDAAGTEQTNTSIPADDSSTFKDILFIGSRVVVRYDIYGQLEHNIVAYNPADGSEVWKTSCYNSHIFWGTTTGLIPLTCDIDVQVTPQNTDVFVEVKALNSEDGSLAWKTNDVTFQPWDSSEISGFLEDKNYLTVPHEHDRQHRLIDLRNGNTVLEGQTRTIDPLTESAVSFGDIVLNDQRDLVGSYGLRVTDTKTRTVIYEMSSDEISALSTFDIYSAYDDRLWFRGPNGFDIVNLNTGERDQKYSPASTGTSNTPSYVITSGENWAIVTRENTQSNLLLRTNSGPISTNDIIATWDKD